MGKELFKNIPSKVGDLVKDVRNGRIGLPDLQRPFVWRDNKVRELFDSMLKGYPIGYIMLWESPVDYESKNMLAKFRHLQSVGFLYMQPLPWFQTP